MFAPTCIPRIHNLFLKYATPDIIVVTRFQLTYFCHLLHIRDQMATSPHLYQHLRSIATPWLERKYRHPALIQLFDGSLDPRIMRYWLEQDYQNVSTCLEIPSERHLVNIFVSRQRCPSLWPIPGHDVDYSRGKSSFNDQLAQSQC